jgi:hypothetical protein
MASAAASVRAESWTHEEFLVACLQREVAASESRARARRDHPDANEIRAMAGCS